MAAAPLGQTHAVPPPRPSALTRLRSGPACILDGDTIDIAGERVRLQGINAPETEQHCPDAQGERWACGARATTAPRGRIAGWVVTCAGYERGRYGRLIDVCGVSGGDLNAWMASAGWAMAYRKYSTAYVAQEAAAKTNRRGVWRGDFIPPWRWRRGDRLGVEEGERRIKGNISSGGRICDVPGGQNYGQTKINEAKGERWFCVPEEAEAAGWRRAKRRGSVK